jgi:hypothetical protein
MSKQGVKRQPGEGDRNRALGSDEHYIGTTHLAAAVAARAGLKLKECSPSAFGPHLTPRRVFVKAALPYQAPLSGRP